MSINGINNEHRMSIPLPSSASDVDQFPLGASASNSPLKPPRRTLPRIFSKEDKGRYALMTLTLINLLNYIDRYVPSATKQYIQSDLHLTDAETSFPLTAFVIVYMICSPIFSWLADLGFKRSRLICAGVILWSIATAAGALAINFWTLLLSRSLVGVGEAAYATIAPALLSDYYRPAQRNAVLSFFYLAIPIGAAMGYALGGEVGNYLGWRYAFLVSGAPGVVVAIMCLGIVEPTPGACDKDLEDEEDEEIEELAANGGETATSKRKSSAHDLMFGLNAEGMNEDAEHDGGHDEISLSHSSQRGRGNSFAVENELGGPAITHPHKSSYAQEGSVPTIVVRSRGASAQSITETGEEDSPQPSSGDELKDASLLPPPWKESIIALLHNATFMYSTCGMACVIFAAGALADWFPSWLNRVHNVPKDSAATMVGAITCVGGIVGTAWGSYIGERAKGVIAQPYLGVSGLNLIITSACGWLIMFVGNVYVIGVLVFIAQVAMWSYTGPINALTVNCVAPNMRVRAFAFQICISHAFGDAVSPSIVGAVSDATDSIRTAMLLIPTAFTCGMIVWLVGWRALKDEDGYDGYFQKNGQNGLVGGTANGDVNLNEKDVLTDPLLDASTSGGSNSGVGGVGGRRSGENSREASIRMKRFDQQHHTQQQQTNDIM